MCCYMVQDLYNKCKRPINCDRGVVILGYRHDNCIDQLRTLTGLRSVVNGKNSVGNYIQGFLTSTNRFVDRKEAADIHKSNGYKVNYFNGKELDSADLYQD